MNRSEADFYCQNDKTYKVSSDLCGNHENVCESLGIEISATVQGSSDAEFDLQGNPVYLVIRKREEKNNE